MAEQRRLKCIKNRAMKSFQADFPNITPRQQKTHLFLEPT
uniref:Uncharacterized protein n=1 Tax=Rhizophora mucronata TaxID=61149 RepID=A0A2P2R270_RHIMU